MRPQNTFKQNFTYISGHVIQKMSLKLNIGDPIKWSRCTHLSSETSKALTDELSYAIILASVGINKLGHQNAQQPQTVRTEMNTLIEQCASNAETTFNHHSRLTTLLLFTSVFWHGWSSNRKAYGLWDENSMTVANLTWYNCGKVAGYRSTTGTTRSHQRSELPWVRRTSKCWKIFLTVNVWCGLLASRQSTRPWTCHGRLITMCPAHLRRNIFTGRLWCFFARILYCKISKQTNTMGLITQAHHFKC